MNDEQPAREPIGKDARIDALDERLKATEEAVSQWVDLILSAGGMLIASTDCTPGFWNNPPDPTGCAPQPQGESNMLAGKTAEALGAARRQHIAGAKIVEIQRSLADVELHREAPRRQRRDAGLGQGRPGRRA